MQLLRNTFLLSIDSTARHTTKIKGHNGKYLTIDADINKWEHANQIGYVHGVPLSIESRYRYDKKQSPIPLKKGDEVVIHFHTTDDSFRVDLPEGVFYKCAYYRIWAKIQDQKLIPMEDFIFVKPIIETDDQLISESGLQVKLYCEEEKRKGIVVAVGLHAKTYGIKEGDRLILTKNAQCDIEIMGVKLWRIRLRNVLGVERKGRLVAVPGRFLVQREDVNNSPFELKEDKAMSKEIFGIVIDSKNEKISAGERVSYTNNFSSEFEHDGQRYSYLTEDNVNYVL
jgi:co-chaperonin GroES (HSP10)